MLVWGFNSLVGAFLVNPGCEKVTCGGERDLRTWREWEGGIDKLKEGVDDWWKWAQACKKCDVAIPSHMQ